MKYIDVSEHQGVIDWSEVKGHIDGVMLRAGYGQHTMDKQFVRNVTECNRLGIPCGAYWFSYAYTADMAKKEANSFLRAVKPYQMDLPLAYDYEYDSVKTGEKNGKTITAALVQSMANAFCQTVESAHYWCMLYANPDFINRYFGTLAGGRYDLWLAQWPTTVDVTKPPRTCGIWQWGGSTVPGINGSVDTNEAYKDYLTFLRSVGCNNLPPVRPWYYEAQQWVIKNGISDGTRPDDAATRAEVWQMLMEARK